MKVVYQSSGEMYDTPAAVDRETGTLYINPKLWFKLTPFQRKFIRLHEQGHYYLNTDSEEAADAYAFDRLAGTEYRSMKQCIETLETILDPNRTGHRIRTEALIQRAIEWDKAHPLRKSSGGGGGGGMSEEAVVRIIQESYAGSNQAQQIQASRETNSDNNRTMVYCMLAIAALFLLKD